MFLLLLSSAFSKFLYLSTKCIFNHLDDVKKFRKGQPMKHASGKQWLHLRVQILRKVLVNVLEGVKYSQLRVSKFCEASFCRVEDRLLLVLKLINAK